MSLVALAGCRSSALSDEMRARIPPNAAAVVITSDLSSGELYSAARTHFNEMGFILAKTDGSQLVLVTESMGVGGTMTDIRLMAVVEQRVQRKARMVISGEFKFPPYGFSRARNVEGDRNRDANAFEEIVVIARQLPHTRVEFWTLPQLDRTGFGDRKRFVSP